MPELSASLAAIHRYPVKGFPGEELHSVRLAAGEGLPGDRRFAITRTVASLAGGAWMSCDSFFINASADGLLRFSQSWDERKKVLILNSPEGQELIIDPDDPASVEAASRAMPLFALSLPQSVSAPPPALAIRNRNPGGLSGYWDFTDSAISLINIESVRDASSAAGRPLDPRRFRGNLLVAGMPAWAEFELPGHRARLGEAELEFIRPAARCPATSVNPDTADRDTKTPEILQEAFGHNYCGIYARCVKGGTVRPGDRLDIIGPAMLALEEARSHGAPDYRLWPKSAEVTGRRVEEDTTFLTLSASGPWPLPEASAGQRLRVHLGRDLWTAADILSSRETMIEVEAGPTSTADPASEHLRMRVMEGSRLIVSGPFGRNPATP